MSMKFIGILCLLVIASAAESVTTRLDNEYFAFNQTQVLAIKESGKWIAAPRLFTLGSKGKKFTIDARGAVDHVPTVCRQVFSSDLPKNPESSTMPKSMLNGDTTQQNYFWGKECAVTLWMTGQRYLEYDPNDNFQNILPKNNSKSVSLGLIEFKNRDQVTTIEFAVLVENAPFAESSVLIYKCHYPSETKANSKLILAALGNNAEQCVTFPYLAKYGKPEDIMPWYHAGIDLKANDQTAYAVVDGTVVVDCGRSHKKEDTACTDSMGIVMIETVLSGSKARVSYVHMSESFVTKGMWVAAGNPIGKTGNRFNGDPNGAGEPHLHIEVRPGYPGTSAVGFISCHPDKRCDTKAKVEAITLDPIGLVASKENPRLLPQLHVGDYFVYGVERYWPYFELWNKEERVVREEKTENVNVWVITGSLKNSTENHIYTSWTDQNSGLMVRSESEIYYSVPENIFFHNKSVNKIVRLKEIRSYDIQNKTEQVSRWLTDATGHTYEDTGTYSNQNPTHSDIKVMHALEIGDWLPWKTKASSNQVLEIQTISVPAGTFTCWKTKFIESGNEYRYRYFDVNTGILVRLERMYKISGRWELTDKEELKRFLFSGY